MNSTANSTITILKITRVACLLILVSFAFAMLMIPLAMMAAGTDPDLPSESTLRLAEPFIVMFAKQYPWICTVIIGIGTLRLIGKPLVAAWHWYCEQTATPTDDAFLAKVEGSRGWKVALFLIDWLGSIKVRPASPNTTSTKEN